LADIVNVEAVATDFAGGVVECRHSGFLSMMPQL
jgi:hypothetical protein